MKTELETISNLKKEVLNILKDTELDNNQIEKAIDEITNINKLDCYHTKLNYDEATKEYKVYKTSLIKTAYHVINGSEKTIKDKQELYASIVDSTYKTKDVDEIITLILQTIITGECYKTLQQECKNKQIEEYMPTIADKFDKLESTIVNKLPKKYKGLYTKEKIEDKLNKVISTVDYEMKLNNLELNK